MEYSNQKLVGGCSSQSTLYLGHSVSPEQCKLTPGTWQMGNVMLFKGLQSFSLINSLAETRIQYNMVSEDMIFTSN